MNAAGAKKAFVLRDCGTLLRTIYNERKTHLELLKIPIRNFETNLERFFMTSEETLKNVVAPSWEPLGSPGHLREHKIVPQIANRHPPPRCFCTENSKSFFLLTLRHRFAPILGAQSLPKASQNCLQNQSRKGAAGPGSSVLSPFPPSRRFANPFPVSRNLVPSPASRR